MKINRKVLIWVLGMLLSVAVILNIFNGIRLNEQLEQVNDTISDLTVQSITLKGVDEQLARKSDVIVKNIVDIEEQLSSKIVSNTINIDENTIGIKNVSTITKLSLDNLKKDLTDQVVSLLQSISVIETALSGQQEYFQQEDAELRLLVEANLVENKHQLTLLETSLRSIDLSIQENIEENSLSLKSFNDSVKDVEEQTLLIRDITARSLLDADTVYSNTKDSVVEILNGDDVAGTGFLVGRNRRSIVTAWHVVDEISSGFLKVRTTYGDTVAGYVSAKDVAEDIAILRLFMPLTSLMPLELSISEVGVGQPVLVIGTPGGMLPGSATSGIIGGVELDKDNFPGAFVNTPSYEPSDLIQFDARVYGGNSGGPVLDVDGKVVGMVSFVLLDDRLTFGPSAPLIEKILARVNY